jgi:uncharacterized membrane protein YidH (DUF202 family)
MDLVFQSGAKTGIASSIIVLPVFLIIICTLHNQYKKEELSHTSGIHKWLTYLMLLVSALVIIGSLVALLVNFLNGEYTANIILKILVVLLIALGIFGFYGYDLRRKKFDKKSLISIIAFAAVVAISVGAIVWGLFLVDSPKVTKMKKFDLQRVEDLTNINSLVIYAYASDKAIPDYFPRMSNYKDPATGKPYEYKILSADQYEICANFALAAPATSYPQQLEWYSHLAGRQCFQKKINPNEIKNLVPEQALKVINN